MKYRDRFSPCLIDPTDNEVFERDPVRAFSFYLAGRVAVLSAFADEILEHLDGGFSPQLVDGSKIARAESLMWLWLLGAYEVVRTMHQAKPCFSAPVLAELGQLKKLLATVRMPAAKMEKAGQKVPVRSDRSPFGWDSARRDLLLNDPEASVQVGARDALAEFDRVFCGIRRVDVLAAHETAYAAKLDNSSH